ncbi:MAG: glycosyltransferase family 4 protein [Planctomycetota bacterium]
MKLAYLVNQYPKVSHAFIRREILAVEAQGVPVRRYSVRPAAELVDAGDEAEAARTDVVLRHGGLALLWATLCTAVGSPGRFLRAVAATWRLGRRSERGVLRNFVYLAEAAWLRRDLARHGITHLHAHFGTNPTSVAMLCHALGGPRFSFTVHGPEEFDKPEAIALGTKVHHAHAVVAITSFARSQLYRWTRFADWPKVQVARCAVDEGWLAQEPPPIAAASRRLVCVGRLCEQKGQALLVQAAQRLLAEGVRFELVLVGDGEMRADIEDLIARHDLGEVVSITGWADGTEVRRQLTLARALVLPSFGEGLPVVIMEAFALGRPVISTSIAGIPELVRDGDNGWLITPGDVTAIAAAMRQVLEADVAELERRGHAGRRAVEARHRADNEARTLARLFGAEPKPLPAPAAAEVVR